ncbi:hypothetical protein V8G54_025746 [Vigna mungo]|uniref:RNase H type-1 domain-containing protein n=1 Tax=Vigna mungo TaxID=3915 RepID=A0AAQ3MZ71_VIGMU
MDLEGNLTNTYKLGNVLACKEDKEFQMTKILTDSEWNHDWCKLKLLTPGVFNLKGGMVRILERNWKGVERRRRKWCFWKVEFEGKKKGCSSSACHMASTTRKFPFHLQPHAYRERRIKCTTDFVSHPPGEVERDNIKTLDDSPQLRPLTSTPCLTLFKGLDWWHKRKVAWARKRPASFDRLHTPHAIRSLTFWMCTLGTIRCPCTISARIKQPSSSNRQIIALRIFHSLNPSKCTFGVKVDKFLDFMLTAWNIKENPNKCATFQEEPTNLKEGGGVGIVLKGPNSTLIEHSLVFKFKVSNHQIEYEALVRGLTLAKDVRAYQYFHKATKLIKGRHDVQACEQQGELAVVCGDKASVDEANNGVHVHICSRMGGLERENQDLDEKTRRRRSHKPNRCQKYCPLHFHQRRYVHERVRQPQIGQLTISWITNRQCSSTMLLRRLCSFACSSIRAP